MSIINSIRSYILDEEFRIIILKNKVNIVNYTSISLIDDNKVVVKHNSLNIFVNGNHLVVSRLMNDELLISGDISSIEFR